MDTKYKSKKHIIIDYITSTLGTWSIYMGVFPRNISDDNLIYAIGEIHTYNPSQFASNIYIGSGAISPRWFHDILISILMDINGGKWEAAALFLMYVGVLLLAVGTVRIVFQLFEKNHLLYSVLFALIITTNRNSLASFTTFTSPSLSIGLAHAVAILALSNVIGEKKNYNIAWIFLALAALLHIHEGVYGAVIVLILGLSDIFIKKKIDIKTNWCFIFYIFAVLGVILPNLLTDPQILSNSEFVNIYAYVRTSHHLVPSVWGKTAILRSTFIVLICAAFRLESLYLYHKETIKHFLIESGIIILSWLGSIIFIYLFTEVYPLAFVSTMMVSKYFKYVIIISFVWLLQTMDVYIDKGSPLFFFLISCYIFSIHKLNLSGILLWALSIIWGIYCEKQKQSKLELIRTRRALHGFEAIFCGMMIAGLFIDLERKMIIILLLIMILGMCLMLAENYHGFICKAVILGLVCMLLSSSVYGNLIGRNGIILYLKTAEDILISTAGNDIYQLAHAYEEHTKEDDMYLADPMDTAGAGWFQVISQRNCYVLMKVVPSIKSNIGEWYERYKLTKNIFEKTVPEIKRIMRQTGTEYILVNQNNYRLFDSEEKFHIFTTCSGDSYRVYQYTEYEDQ